MSNRASTAAHRLLSGRAFLPSCLGASRPRARAVQSCARSTQLTARCGRRAWSGCLARCRVRRRSRCCCTCATSLAEQRQHSSPQARRPTALLPTPPHHALPTPRLLRYKPDAASTPDAAAPCPGCRGGSRADQVHSRGRRPAHGWAADRLRFRHRAARRRKGMRPSCLPPLPASPSRRLRLRSARRC